MKFLLEAFFEQWILVILAGVVIGVVSWLRGKGKGVGGKWGEMGSATISLWSRLICMRPRCVGMVK